MRKLRLIVQGGWLRLLTAAVALAPTAAVWAAAAPQPGIRRSPSPVWGYLLIVVAMVATISVSLMPSKRSHQD